MPYIQPENRDVINGWIEGAECHIRAEGDLTYAITYLMHLRTLRQKSENGGRLRYAKLSAVRASAQDSADEFYRVVMAPYEDKKREENGAVSELDPIKEIV